MTRTDDRPTPIKEVEDKHGMKDLGRTLLWMLRGMDEEGATFTEKVIAMAAFMRASAEREDIDGEAN